MLPVRRQDLLIEQMEDESVVYDPARYRAHCLNQTAQLVLRACDGKASLTPIAARVRGELRVPVSEDVVRSALEKLSRAHLLEERFPRSAKSHPVSRRTVIATGVAAVVVSMAVPSSALAEAPPVARPAVIDGVMIGRCTKTPFSKSIDKAAPIKPESCVKKRVAVLWYRRIDSGLVRVAQS